MTSFASSFAGPLVLVGPAADVGSPAWWRDRLLGRLLRRARDLDRFDRYYRGDHDLPWLAEQAEDEFRRVLAMANSNYMGLVVDAKAERIEVTGFRFDDGPGDSPDGAEVATAPAVPAADEAFTGDRDAWAIWQYNGMDSVFPQVVHEALKLGTAYLLVAPNPDDKQFPLITGEHPAQCIVEYEPGSRRKAVAGLKAWRDDVTGELMATLFLPEQVFKWRTGKSGWEPRPVEGEAWPAPNPLGEIPLYEIPNNPSLLGEGVSELADVIPIQDRINKTLADRLMTQDYGAFPQRWALGFPAKDEAGNDQQVAVGRTRMVTNDVAANQAAFGQFATAPLDPYSKAKSEDVKDIASRKRVPAQYLLGDMINTAGETLKVAEAGLVATVLQIRRPMGESVEDAMRAAFRLRGDAVRGQDRGAETIWRNPEYRTEGELVDALVKLATLGVPLPALWEQYGFTPQQIRRFERMQAEQVARSGVGTLQAIVDGTASADGFGVGGQPAAAG